MSWIQQVEIVGQQVVGSKWVKIQKVGDLVGWVVGNECWIKWEFFWTVGK